MTDLRSLVNAVFDNPLEETPRNMLRDFCAEEGITWLRLDHEPRTVVMKPIEAIHLARCRFTREYIMMSTVALGELVVGNRNGEYGLPKTFYRFNVYVAEQDRPDVFTEINQAESYLSRSEFLDLVLRSWNLTFPTINLVYFGDLA